VLVGASNREWRSIATPTTGCVALVDLVLGRHVPTPILASSIGVEVSAID
jgi:hypothetical protein